MLTCDFCLAKHPELWGFRVAPFEVRQNMLFNGRPTSGLATGGEWAACDECLQLLKTDSRQLAARIHNLVGSQPAIELAANGPGLEELLGRFYAALRDHITGTISRIDDQTTPLPE